MLFISLVVSIFSSVNEYRSGIVRKDAKRFTQSIDNLVLSLILYGSRRLLCAVKYGGLAR